MAEYYRHGVEENHSYTAAQDVFAAAFTPKFRNSSFRITVAHSVATTVIARLNGAATTNLLLNSGASIQADTLYTFNVPWCGKDGTQTLGLDIQLGTSGTIRLLIVDEIKEGVD